jgi:D-erythro-7,8-dihydroneopterin triphosphate epimerase
MARSNRAKSPAKRRNSGKALPARRSGVVATRATIRITDLALRTIIGINEWERHHPQDIVINVSMDFDPSAAVESDRIEDTVDYKGTKRRIMELVERSQFGLIEKLAHAILGLVMDDTRVLAARVRVDKPHALRFADSVSVEMAAERGA